MRNGDASVVSGLFGVPGQVEVERGLAEFRGGRPVRITTPEKAVIALPVDGIDARRLAAFAAFTAPTPPRLVITARRARALGLDVAEPVAIALAGTDDVESILALVADATIPRPVEAAPAGAPAKAAIELAKFAQRLPALLVAEADATSPAYDDPPIVSVDAESIARFRRSV